MYRNLNFLQVFPDKLLLPTFKREESSLGREGRSEVDRRRVYIDILVSGLNNDENHPLVLLVKECLANEPDERPAAKEIVQRLQQQGYSKQLIHVVREVCC